jgi:xylose isomerase
MKITSASLNKLETKYKDYLDGKIIDQFFEEFGIKFAAGQWAAGGFRDRFASSSYNPGLDESMTAKISCVAKAGIKGIEFHDTNFTKADYTIDKSKIKEVKTALAKYKLVPTNMNTDLFSDNKWKLGGITNASKSIREQSLAFALQGIDIGKEIGCTSVALWPGSDG